MKLDFDQKNAVLAKEQNILVCACPGAGKTQVIVSRVYNLTNNMKVNENNIIVLTFTKAAALNMKKRYINTFKINRTPFFGTFHGLFYKILSRYYGKINIIKPFIANKIIESVLRKYLDDISQDKIKEIINEISIFKTSQSDMESFISTVEQHIFNECYNEYANYKKEKNLWDFDDLALAILDLFQKNNILKEKYKKSFKHILVDEFQDCDELQVKFLKMFIGSENNIYAVEIGRAHV